MSTQPVNSVNSAGPLTGRVQRRRGPGVQAGKGGASNTLVAYLFLLPYLIILGVFTIFVSL
jgi:hypothetical protein